MTREIFTAIRMKNIDNLYLFIPELICTLYLYDLVKGVRLSDICSTFLRIPCVVKVMFGVVRKLLTPLRCWRKIRDLARRNLLKVTVTHCHVCVPSEAQGSIEDTLQLGPVDGRVLPA